MGCRKPIKHSKRKDQSYGFMCIFRHHNRACEVEGIDVVLRGIKDHKKCIFGALIPYSCLPIDKHTYIHEKIFWPARMTS